MRLLLFAILFSTVPASWAEISCAARDWTFKNRKVDRATLVKGFEQLSRQDLVQLAWGEMQRDPQDSLALPTLHYLAATENEKLLRGYYKTMGHLVYEGSDMQSAMNSWPNVKGLQKPKLSLSETCRLYKETLKTLAQEKKKSKSN